MSEKAGGKKAGKSKPSPAAAPGIDELGELPRSYGADTIFLVAQEPHWLFTYWDIDISLHPGGKTFLRVLKGSDQIEAEIEVPFETRNWYIPVKESGAEYTVEIGYFRGSQWNVLARSVTAKTPPEKMSESQGFEYATVPLHLSFQRLIENIETAVREGETLIQALSRLQKDGRLLPVAPAMSPGSDEYVVLEALLGRDLLEELSSSALSSEDLNSRICQHLEEKLHSAGSSTLLSNAEWGAASSSLFSAITAISGGASWNAATLSSWAAAALSSWAAASQASWSGGASWSGSESASWSHAAKSLSSESIPTSWTPQALSSWLHAATTSWAAAALGSWSKAALASWSHAATTSWGGSENVGSFGFAQREFFMHVNAEVIFYGGTHPQASVTIDGKPVRLNPDGTFRHHFIFPDGDYEIPITATSPDGLETRSATLRFHRATAREGDVGHTGQPPLPAPMGARH